MSHDLWYDLHHQCSDGFIVHRCVVSRYAPKNAADRDGDEWTRAGIVWLYWIRETEGAANSY